MHLLPFFFFSEGLSLLVISVSSVFDKDLSSIHVHDHVKFMLRFSSCTPSQHCHAKTAACLPWDTYTYSKRKWVERVGTINTQLCKSAPKWPRAKRGFHFLLISNGLQRQISFYLGRPSKPSRKKYENRKTSGSCQ